MYNESSLDKMKHLGFISLFIPVLCQAQAIDPTKPIAFELAPEMEETSGASILEENSPLKLNALWVSENRRQATINDQLFGIGDRIDGMEILTINTEGVTLQGDLGVELLTLNESNSFKQFLQDENETSDGVYHE